MIPPLLLVGAGGALGASARYLVDRRVGDAAFPAGTLLVNVVGSGLLGLLTFGGVGSDAALLLGTGVCGAFTTFSSFAVETTGLWERGDRGLALGNAVGTLAGALAGVGLAWLLA